MARYLVDVSALKDASADDVNDDDAAEGRGTTNGASNEANGDRNDRKSGKGKKDKKKQKGQNTERSFGKCDDAFRICNSRAFYPEF